MNGVGVDAIGYEERTYTRGQIEELTEAYRLNKDASAALMVAFDSELFRSVKTAADALFWIEQLEKIKRIDERGCPNPNPVEQWILEALGKGREIRPYCP